MPREFLRSRRVEEAIQRTLGEALAGKTRDPRLSGVMITAVQVSRDISFARVFYTLLSGEKPGPEIGEGLRAATGFFRTIVAQELRVRHVPELRFQEDEALARGRSLEDLIHRAVHGDATAGDESVAGGDATGSDPVSDPGIDTEIDPEIDPGLDPEIDMGRDAGSDSGRHGD